MLHATEPNATKLLSTQLVPSIVSTPSPSTISSLTNLEHTIDHCEECYEWRCNVFNTIPSSNNEINNTAQHYFLSASTLASNISPVTCRGLDIISLHDTQQIHAVSVAVVYQSYQLLNRRLANLFNAIHTQLPHLTNRLKIGADVTIRRTLGTQHGTPAPYEKHNPSAVHSDSHDGTVLGFGLISTKLGTPTYPDAIFPTPISMFISQSRTGRNNAHQLNVDTLGALQPWTPGSLVVMPACVAHSKPSRQQIEQDIDPTIPRWFCRATLRILIPDLWKRGGRTKEARQERLDLSLLVAKYIWNDRNFANNAEIISKMNIQSPRKKKKNQNDQNNATTKLTRKEKQKLMKSDIGTYEGEYKETTKGQKEGQPLIRHGAGTCVYKNGCIYIGNWSNGKKDGQGIMTMKNGREYNGEWKENVKHGMGKYLFHNGNVYVGEFVNGMPKDQEGLDSARDGRNRKQEQKEEKKEEQKEEQKEEKKESKLDTDTSTKGTQKGTQNNIDQWTLQILTSNKLDQAGYVISMWPLIRMTGGSNLLTEYNRFSVLLEPHLPTNCELYPPSALHITIATLSSFTEGVFVDEKILKNVLNVARNDSRWPLNQQLEVIIQQPTLSKGNCGFFFNDGKGTVNLIRECLKTASIGTEIESRIKCPTIVHSTMLRFVDSTDVPLSFRKTFTDIAKQWKPIAISSSTIDLVRESMPYMHMPLPARHHLVHSVSMVKYTGSVLHVSEYARKKAMKLMQQEKKLVETRQVTFAVKNTTYILEKTEYSSERNAIHRMEVEEQERKQKIKAAHKAKVLARRNKKAKSDFSLAALAASVNKK